MILLEKKVNKIRKKYWRGLLSFRNRYSGVSGICEDSDIIVSLTSFPERIHLVYLTIETILRQTEKPKKILLWLSEEQFEDKSIPESLLRQQERGLEVRFVKGDLKSYKKLIYSLREFPEGRILTADDDVYYPSWWVEKISLKEREYPDCVVCYRSRLMKRKSNEELMEYSDWGRVTFSGPSYEVFPIGVSGVMYKASLFDEEFFREEVFTEICPNTDDIWFKAMALRMGTKAVQVYDKGKIFQTIDGSQVVSLFQTNVLGKRNDVCLRAVFERYNLFDKISY